MHLKYFCFFLLLLLSIGSYAQSVTIRGNVTDAQSGEALLGATIFIEELRKGVSASLDGDFTLTITPPDTLKILTVQVSFAGYEPYLAKLSTQNSHTLNIGLKTKLLQEVVIEDKMSFEDRVKEPQMSVEKIEVEQIKLLPVMFGEVDIIKTLQLKPGVGQAQEGFAGFYVRGGGADQNLITLDGFTIYNPNHLVGFFSVFNSDFISSAQLYKGDFPARFGGRLSSILEIESKPANAKKVNVQGGLGLIASRLSVSGPLLGNKISYTVSGRRTYFDVFTRAYNKTRENDPLYEPIPDYYFYDLNARVDYRPDTNNLLSFVAYQGNDNLVFKSNSFSAAINWGNKLYGLTWVHNFSNNWYSEVKANYTGYNFIFNYQFEDFKTKYESGVNEYSVNANLFYEGKNNSRFNLGVRASAYDFNNGQGTLEFGSSRKIPFGNDILSASELNLFVEGGRDILPRLFLKGGIRTSFFFRENKMFAFLLPRASLRYMVTDKSSIKMGYARTAQFLHLLSTSGGSFPTDMWYPTGRNVQPQHAQQVSLGYSRTLIKGKLLLSNEVFYKQMPQQIDLGNGANIVANPDIESDLVFGRGWAYGNEVYLEKKGERFSGWFGYTLSWSYRQFDQINNGRPFFPRYDRRHDVSVVGTYKLSNRFTLSSTFVYSTGNAVTLPAGRFVLQDLPGTIGTPPGFLPYPIYTDRNGYRMDAYHRLDFGLVYKLQPRWGQADITLSIYNLYSRMNPFFIYFDTEWENPVERNGRIVGFTAKQVALLPILPTITFNFKF